MKEFSTRNVNGFNVAYRPNTPDEEVIHDTLEASIFLKGFPEYRIRPDHTVMDIGAHIGTYSIQAASLANRGKVYAFEPCQDTFDLLEKNVELNKSGNVTVHKVALTNYIGEAKLYYDLQYGNWGHSITKALSDEGEVVKTDTLANFMEVQGITKVDFVKFNCEGAEFKILLSTPVNVLQRIDTMLVLYHLDLETELTIEQLIAHLRNSGFYTEIRKVSDQGKRGWLIAMRPGLIQKIILIANRFMRPGITLSRRIINKLRRVLG